MNDVLSAWAAIVPETDGLDEGSEPKEIKGFPVLKPGSLAPSVPGYMTCAPCMHPGALFLILQGFLKDFAIFSYKANGLPIVKL